MTKLHSFLLVGLICFCAHSSFSIYVENQTGYPLRTSWGFTIDPQGISNIANTSFVALSVDTTTQYRSILGLRTIKKQIPIKISSRQANWTNHAVITLDAQGKPVVTFQQAYGYPSEKLGNRYTIPLVDSRPGFIKNSSRGQLFAGSMFAIIAASFLWNKRPAKFRRAA